TLNMLINTPTVGASGAIYGLLLAFGMLFPNAVIYIYFAFPLKAKYFVIIYAALELYLGIANHSDNIAHFAHLGGMLFGLIFILIWRKNRFNRWN
ncbi:MAG TPA: rhomboid family intramembrane serine protease, partial [Bacteroidales bacterium]|nr:rhomboid family intramembrane serine protease [Bacteroidales bacterium]